MARHGRGMSRRAGSAEDGRRRGSASAHCGAGTAGKTHACGGRATRGRLAVSPRADRDKSSSGPHPTCGNDHRVMRAGGGRRGRTGGTAAGHGPGIALRSASTNISRPVSGLASGERESVPMTSAFPGAEHPVAVWLVYGLPTVAGAAPALRASGDAARTGFPFNSPPLDCSGGAPESPRSVSRAGRACGGDRVRRRRSQALHALPQAATSALRRAVFSIACAIAPTRRSASFCGPPQAPPSPRRTQLR